MSVQVGTVDGLINITPVIKDCFVKAIESFALEVVKSNKLGELSIGDAFQRYTYPVYSKLATKFDLKSLEKEVTTKTGKKQSPAYVTYCKKMGLLETDGSELFQLTPVGQALNAGEIDLHEYALLYMSKQGIFIDGQYKENLLVHVANIFKVSSSVTTDELLLSIATKYGDSDFQKTRSDIILGALCTAKILCKINNTYVLAGIAQAQILDLFAENGKHISPALLDTNPQYADYVGTFKYGLYDFLNEKNISSFAHLYPNLMNYLQEKDKQNPSLPLQQIFYGAPGTGKSHETNRVTRVYRDTIRTTFHPDSDYSTFVGAYKPTTTREFVYGLNGGNTVQYSYNGKPLETTKIVYKFVKQAFLKAYILAWKKMCKRSFTFTDPAGSKFTITSVSDTGLEVHKEEFPNKQSIKNTWEQAWKNNGFYPKPESGSGNALYASVAQWIKDNMQNSSKENFEEGWKILLDKLKNSNSIETSTIGGNQTYNVKLKDDTSLIVTTLQKRTKDTIRDPQQPTFLIDNVRDILKNYNLPFDEAWLRLKVDVTNNEGGNCIPPQFLVIEEINRGNCAQIFGDIFQLLDRKGGYSEYPIEADEDIKKALLEDNPADGLSFGSTGLQLSDEIKEELKALYKDSVDDIVSKICMGDVLVLPKNLYIWATMNTSDQSLFPIDSAFKRRWDWTYIPIKKPTDKDPKVQDWTIQVGTTEYDWWQFIKAINNVINDVTSSEDKKLGYFFCKANDKKIDADKFVNKVIFYLWNDVLKDYEMPKEFEYGETKKKEDSSKSNHMSFNDFYTDKEACIRQLMENLDVEPIAKEVKTATATTSATTTGATTPTTSATPATDSTTEQTLF